MLPIEGAGGLFISGSNAYVTCHNEVEVVDIGNPRSPAIVMHVNDIDILGLYVSGSYA